MRRVRNTITVWLAVFIVFRSVSSFAALPDHPFSDAIDWDDEEKRKGFEQYLALAGITIRYLKVEHPNTKRRWAKSLYFMVLEKGGLPAGFGAAFYDLVLPGTASGPYGDNTIRLDRAEILYDLSGRRIFLITYRTEMSLLHRIFWNFLPEQKKKEYRKKYRLEAERHIFGWGELGEGYELDRRSREYAGFLLDSPVIFKEVLDKENPSSASVLVVPFGSELFRRLSP